MTVSGRVLPWATQVASSALRLVSRTSAVAPLVAASSYALVVLAYFQPTALLALSQTDAVMETSTTPSVVSVAPRILSLPSPGKVLHFPGCNWSISRQAPHTILHKVPATTPSTGTFSQPLCIHVQAPFAAPPTQTPPQTPPSHSACPAIHSSLASTLRLLSCSPRVSLQQHLVSGSSQLAQRLAPHLAGPVDSAAEPPAAATAPLLRADASHVASASPSETAAAASGPTPALLWLPLCSAAPRARLYQPHLLPLPLPLRAQAATPQPCPPISYAPQTQPRH